MVSRKDANKARLKRHKRVRAKISGTAARPRLRVHEAGKGAKYTRGRGPLKLRYQEICESYSHALRREIEIKRMKRQDKLNLLGSLPNLNN